MSIYQRGNTWWIQVTSPNGKKIQRSARTKIKEEAQEFHDRFKTELWRIKNLGEKTRHTWQEAVVRWLTEQSHKKSIRDDKKHLRWLNPHLHDKKLDEINKDLIERITAAKAATGVKNATVNRMLALLRSILNRSVKDWEWLDSAPTVRLLNEPNKRIRWLTHDEAQKLFKELPDHLEVMARFTLATGLRESNVTGLMWEQIDMQRRCCWIHPDQAKTRKAIAVPLNSDAIDIIRDQLGKNQRHVFTYRGEPVTRANNHAWQKALVRAGIKDFRWHDLRHTWASWHIQNGTPLHILQELGGWSDLSMVLRYAHLSSKHLEEYAGNAKSRNPNLDANLLQSKNQKS